MFTCYTSIKDVVVINLHKKIKNIKGWLSWDLLQSYVKNKGATLIHLHQSDVAHKGVGQGENLKSTSFIANLYLLKYSLTYQSFDLID